MKKNEVMIFVEYSEKTPLTLSEISEACRVKPNFIIDLINDDIIKPINHEGEWMFSVDHVREISIAKRLYHDLEMNLAGIAIVIDLIKENDHLREKLIIFEKYFSNI